MMVGRFSLRYRRLLGGLCRQVSYVQGQSPTPKTREYFYFIDHQGQLFLDDTKVKNFVTCFKDKKFLAFFFKRLRVNSTDRYADDFPYVSLCGREMNYIRCDDVPVVFTHLLGPTGEVLQDVTKYAAKAWQNDGAKPPPSELLSYGGTGNLLTTPFQPRTLRMLAESGRVYHSVPEGMMGGGVGLVKSSLAIELSQFFGYEDASNPEVAAPVKFRWKGQEYKLDNS